MQQPLVSIIIPTYNRASRIIKTLDSIFAQTYQNFEIIVVDDGSTDDTIQILNGYKQSVTRNDIVFKILKQKNAGAPAARNNGLRNATGEYVVFFDSDDLMLSERIKTQVKIMITENSDCCACGYYDGNDNECLPPLITESNILLLFIKSELKGSTQCWMFKKSLLLLVNGYDESLICRQDLDIVFRILLQRPKISFLRQALSFFVDNEDISRISKRVQNDPDAYISTTKYHTKIIDYCVNNKKLKLLFVAGQKYCRDIVFYNFSHFTYWDLLKELKYMFYRNKRYTIINQIYIMFIAVLSLHCYLFKQFLINLQKGIK